MYKNLFKLKIISLCLLMFFTVASSVYAGNIIRSFEGNVIKVSDGDTLTVETKEGTKVKVRLVGVDSPENSKINHKTGRVKIPGQPFGEEAKELTERLVNGYPDKSVRVHVYGVDQYKRVLAFVDVKEASLNHELVKAGLAEVYKGGEYGPYKKELYELERRAKESKVGMWSLGDKYESPRDFRRRLKIKGE